MAFFCLLFLFSRQNDTKVCKNWYVTTSHLRYSKATHLVHRFSLCYVYVAAESLKLFKRAEKIGYIFDVSQKSNILKMMNISNTRIKSLTSCYPTLIVLRWELYHLLQTTIGIQSSL